MIFEKVLKVLGIVIVLFSGVLFLHRAYATKCLQKSSESDLKRVNQIDEKKLKIVLSSISASKLKISKRIKEGVELIPLNGTDYNFTVVAYKDGDTLYLAPKKIGEPIYAPENCSHLFYKLNFREIDLEGLDTSEVENMECMFCSCTMLERLNLGSSFDTSKVTSMICMFANCRRLEYLDLGESFYTNNADDVSRMFTCCFSLNSLNLGEHFDTRKVKNMRYMFTSCISLVNLDLKDLFYTDLVTDMTNMFANCSVMSHLNLGNHFDISKCQDNMQNIFSESFLDFQVGEYMICSDKDGENFKRIFSLMQKASAHDADAMLKLGDCYRNGEGVPVDYNQAMKCYEQAVKCGGFEAMVGLGDIYYNGEGVSKDLVKAVKFYEQASEKGSLQAKLRLGRCYLNGDGKEKNVKTAIDLFGFVLDKDSENTEAMIGMGDCCFEKHDCDTAVDLWYNRAILRNSIEARFNLAVRYYTGEGVEENVEKALEYFQIVTDEVDVKYLRRILDFYSIYRLVDEDIGAKHAMIMAAYFFALGDIFYGDGKCEREVLNKVLILFQCAFELGYEDAAKRLYDFYWFGKGVKRDTLKAVEFLYEIEKRHKHIDAFKDEKDLADRINEFFEFLNDNLVSDEVCIYFEDYFEDLKDFLFEEDLIQEEPFDGVTFDDKVFRTKLSQNEIDIVKLKVLLSKAEKALEILKAVKKNDDSMDNIFEKINDCVDKSAFERAMKKYGVVLKDLFFHSYALSRWRTVPISEHDLTDEGIQLNIYGTILTDDDALVCASNIYDYIFLDRGSWTKRLEKLEKRDCGQARELLAREMYWLQVMTKKYKEGLLSPEQRDAFEVCNNLFKVHFLSATRACHNELANIIMLWAKDIDDYEVATGEGLKVDSQEKFDAFVNMSCRERWLEKIVNYIELSKFKDDPDIGEFVSELMLCIDNSTFGQEYRNYYKFIVAKLLNEIVPIGNNIAVDSLLTSQIISEILAKMISINDICEVSKKVYHVIADEYESMDLDCTILKDKLISDIENQYEVSFSEFCKVVDLTCEKGFAQRFEKFLGSSELDDDEDSINCLKDWKAGKVKLTLHKLIQCVLNLDVMLSECNVIPELMRFTSIESCSLSENLSEYYSKVLYPIYLWKTRRIDMI